MLAKQKVLCSTHNSKFILVSSGSTYHLHIHDNTGYFFAQLNLRYSGVLSLFCFLSFEAMLTYAMLYPLSLSKLEDGVSFNAKRNTPNSRIMLPPILLYKLSPYNQYLYTHIHTYTQFYHQYGKLHMYTYYTHTYICVNCVYKNNKYLTYNVSTRLHLGQENKLDVYKFHSLLIKWYSFRAKIDFKMGVVNSL